MVTLLALLFTPKAFALNCDEIVQMLEQNVPAKFVVQTIEDSGTAFTKEDVRCLTNADAPAEIVTAVRSTMAKSATPSEGGDDGDAPKEDKRSAYDKEEALGSRDGGGGKSKSRELEDRDGGDDGEGGGDSDPEKLASAIKAYNAKKPLTSSLKLLDLLKDNTYPEKESKILYYMGRSLYDLGMYHSAQYYFTEVLKKGPSNPYFKYALPKLVTITKFTGDQSDLAKIVAKIPPEEFPRQARNQLYYLLGVRLYEQEKFTEARKAFAEVGDKSDLYIRAKYFEGVILAKQEKYKSAVQRFQEVAKADAEAPTQQELEEYNRLRDLSLLNIARIYYGLTKYDEARKWYEAVPRNSRYWPESLFEGAWSNFMLSDLNYSLGQILTVASPFYNEDEFVPEAQILKSLTYFNLCEYDQVDRVLTRFNTRYAPVNQELKDVLKQYGSEEGKKLADQAYDRYFGGKDDRKDTTLPKSMFVRLLRDQELAGLVKHLELLDKERALIGQQKAQWKDGVGEELNRIIAADRERLARRAGLAMLREMKVVSDHLTGLLGQADIIKFEVVDAQRAGYVYKAQNSDLMDSSSKYEIDFATSPDRIYWPFNGEFWKDELGYYYYTEQGSCK
jgi:TolA-binding protein